MKTEKITKSKRHKNNDENSEEKTYERQELQYPFVRRSVVVLDHDWMWLVNNKFTYNCSSASSLVRKLIRAEIVKPRSTFVSKVKPD